MTTIHSEHEGTLGHDLYLKRRRAERIRVARDLAIFGLSSFAAGAFVALLWMSLSGCVPAPDPGDTQGELPVEIWGY